VYRAVDDALAEHLAIAGPDTDVLVMFSHGMGPKYDATMVLDPLLCRLAAADAAGARGSRLGRIAKRTWETLPTAARRALGRPLAARLRRRLRDSLPPPGDWGETRRSRRPYYAVPNNSPVGGIRINVAGREAAGIVDPADVDRVCAELRDRLLEVVNVDTGAPIIARVTRLDAEMERLPPDRFPDLILEWNRETPVTTVWSPRAGVVTVPYDLNRRGDHYERGMVLATGPSFPAATTLPDVDIVDLAPTLCSLLGVDMPGVDGRPIAALADDSLSPTAPRGATP
jgi:predicted AlkP superfamily phosphohydrolase/phosphomutase